MDLPMCKELENLNDAQFGYTIIVILGTIISNIPQQYRIARRRSAEGVSAYWLLTGLVSATCGFANILALSIDIFRCCKAGAVSEWQCISGIMGVVYDAVIWTVMAVIVLIWSIVLPITKWEYPDKPHATVQHMIAVNVLCAVHVAITMAALEILITRAPERLHAFATAQGILSAVIAALQYAPQIITTWRLKHIGSISIPWLVIQTPGGLAAMPALVNRPGTNWTSWLAYLGTFAGQLVLLIICCCWAWRDYKASKARGEHEPWTRKNWHRRLWRWIWH